MRVVLERPRLRVLYAPRRRTAVAATEKSSCSTEGRSPVTFPTHVTRRVHWRHNEVDEAHARSIEAPRLRARRRCQCDRRRARRRYGHPRERHHRPRRVAPRNVSPAQLSDAYRAYVASIQNGEPAASANYAATKVRKIPAFARKYGLRCSACHTVWPELNSFGQQFRDNGYQMQNERDSPVAQSNGYIPHHAPCDATIPFRARDQAARRRYAG